MMRMVYSDVSSDGIRLTVASCWPSKQPPNRFHRQEEAVLIAGEGEEKKMDKKSQSDMMRLDRCYFSLRPRELNRFLKALERTPKDLARLRKILTTPTPWGQ